MADNEDLETGATLRGFAEGQRVFGRYRLERILGRGGMGVVWLAFDEELQRQVALKFVPELVCLEREAISDLKRETRKSLEITHPNIVRIYDFHQDAQTAAISMEYAGGTTLSALKVERGGCLGTAELRPIVRQLCEALDYAHQDAKVVHRDLKPANLMLDSKGKLKIADFGISCSISDSVSRVSVARGSSGTVVFMSPQQALGHRPTPADDIYALGATLYDLLSGKPPFYRGDVLTQMREEVPQLMAERREELGLTGQPIPESWETAVRDCLAKEPEARPRTAGEVWARLHVQESVGQSPPDSRVSTSAHADAAGGQSLPREAAVAGRRPEPQARRAGPRVAWTAALLALLGVCAAGCWYFFAAPPSGGRRAELERLARERPPIERESARLQADAEARAAEAEAQRLAAQREKERSIRETAEREAKQRTDALTARLAAEAEAAKAQAAEAKRQQMAAEAKRQAEAANLMLQDEFDGTSRSARALFPPDVMRFDLVNGAGRLTSTSTGILPAMYSHPQLRDFVAEFEFRAALNDDTGLGLIFRSEDATDGLASYYMLLIHPFRQVAVLACWNSGKWASWREQALPPNILASDGANQIRFEAIGSRFRARLNGRPVLDVEDPTLQKPGLLGLCLSPASPRQTTVDFDNLAIHRVPPTTAPP